MAFSTRLQLPFLASLQGRRDVESRRVLLRVITDQFVNDPAPSPEIIADYEKEAAPLLADCDPATRLIVARKLASRPTAPAAMLDLILRGGGEAALTVLERAVAIGRDRSLAAIDADPASASAIARRADLDDEMVDRLALHAAPEVALALTENASATLAAQIFAALVRRAVADESLAKALLARAVAPLDAAALFLYASSSQRAAMLIAAQRAELARSTPSSVWTGAAAAVAKLERCALARQPTKFVATLGEALGCNPDFAARIAAEPSGEPLAVALAALGAPEDATMRILLLGEAVNLDYRRLGALTRLRDALHPAAARRIVSAMVGAQREQRLSFDAALDPTAAPTPSRAAPSRQGATTPDAAHILRRRRAFQLSAAPRLLRDA